MLVVVGLVGLLSVASGCLIVVVLMLYGLDFYVCDWLGCLLGLDCCYGGLLCCVFIGLPGFR